MNKYLEKVAAMDHKLFSKEEKAEYEKGYNHTRGKTLGLVGSTLLSAVGARVGAVSGLAAGVTNARKLGTGVGRLVSKALRSTGRAASATVNPSIKAYTAVRKAAPLTGLVSGGILGSLPGSLAYHKIRRNSGEKAVEKYRNRNSN